MTSRGILSRVVARAIANGAPVITEVPTEAAQAARATDPGQRRRATAETREAQHIRALDLVAKCGDYPRALDYAGYILAGCDVAPDGRGWKRREFWRGVVSLLTRRCETLTHTEG